MSTKSGAGCTSGRLRVWSSPPLGPLVRGRGAEVHELTAVAGIDEQSRHAPGVTVAIAEKERPSVSQLLNHPADQVMRPPAAVPVKRMPRECAFL